MSIILGKIKLNLQGKEYYDGMPDNTICIYRAYVFGGSKLGGYINVTLTCGAPKGESISICTNTYKVISPYSVLFGRVLIPSRFPLLKNKEV